MDGRMEHMDGTHEWASKKKTRTQEKQLASVPTKYVQHGTNTTLTKGIDDTGVFHVFHVWIWFAQRPSFSSYELKDKR